MWPPVGRSLSVPVILYGMLYLCFFFYLTHSVQTCSSASLGHCVLVHISPFSFCNPPLSLSLLFTLSLSPSLTLLTTFMQNTSSHPIFSFFPQIARFYSFASLPPTPALALIYLESDLPFSLVLTDFDNNIMVCHRESGGNRGGGCCLIPQPVTVALCGLTPSTVIPNCSKLSSGTHNLADKY